MRAHLLRSLVAIAVLALAVPALAGVDIDRKIEVNKIINMIGFTPNLNASAVTGETEPNDDCSTPDAADIFADDTSGAIDVGGDEDWFVFQGLAGECVTFGTESYNGSSTDTQLYLYAAADCGDPGAWLVWDDDDGPGLFSLIENFELPASGSYYLRVKHFSATGTGEYLLTAGTAACLAAPDNNLCVNAEPLACNSTVSGTTDLATNDLEDLTEICVPFGADGPDVFYSVEVPAGFTISATLVPVDWDPALWIVTDCTDENTCVAGADTGFFNDPEMVSWTNASASPVTVYVIPDSYTASVSGDFDLTVSCEQTVSTSQNSWGEVKSQF